MTRLAKDLAALVTMSPAQLRDCWMGTYGSVVPSVPDSLLRRALAHNLQEVALGGLSAVSRRTLEAMAAGGPAAQGDLPVRMKPGTRLMRQWNGRMHAVLVTDAGFEFDGKSWKSLSAIAQRITGAHWSGPRFFGVKPPQLPPVQGSRNGQP